jgi:hypothetical protein
VRVSGCRVLTVTAEGEARICKGTVELKPDGSR